MKPDDTDLVLYADGLLDPERKEQLLQTAANDASLASTLAALDASRLPFKAAFDQQPMPAVPDKLRDDLHNLTRVTRELGVAATPIKPTRMLLSTHLIQAACLAICLVLGYAIGTTVPTEQSQATIEQHDRSQTQITWVERVLNYQSLYVANTTRHLRADWQAAKNTIERLTNASDMKGAIPDLSAAGYEFARVQELGFEGQPVLQLIYNKEGKTPLALCFMPANNEANATLRVKRHPDQSIADWITHNQRFALVADETSITLKQLFEIIRAEFAKA